MIPALQQADDLLAQSDRRGEFNPYVHGARGIFALQLLVFHIAATNWPIYEIVHTKGGYFLLRILEYGVELFFCVSGYVMVQAIGRARSAGEFLRDRAIRILPLLWIVVMASIALGLLDGRRPLWARPADELAVLTVANMLALPGILPIPIFNPASWSLSYEFVLYFLCAGWILLRAGERWPARAALLLVAACLILIYPRGLAFVVGVYVAWRPGRHALTGQPLAMIAIFLAGWSLVQALSPTGMLLADTYLVAWVQDGRIVIAAAALACLYLGFTGIVAGGTSIGRFLCHPYIQFLGTISYSFYLWQNVAMGASRRVLRLVVGNDPGHFVSLLLFPVLTFALLLPLAFVSRHVIEIGCARWLRRLLGIAPALPMTAMGGISALPGGGATPPPPTSRPGLRRSGRR